MAAVNKMKLMDTLEDSDGSDEEGHGGGTRPATRASKRSAVIQSSSDSDEEEASQEGMNIYIAYLEMFCVQISNVT